MPQPFDAATPEAYPGLFLLGRCAACAKCHLQLRVRHCPCGGPFNARLEYDIRSFIPMKETA